MPSEIDVTINSNEHWKIQEYSSKISTSFKINPNSINIVHFTSGIRNLIIAVYNGYLYKWLIAAILQKSSICAGNKIKPAPKEAVSFLSTVTQAKLCWTL